MRATNEIVSAKGDSLSRAQGLRTPGRASRGVSRSSDPTWNTQAEPTVTRGSRRHRRGAGRLAAVNCRQRAMKANHHSQLESPKVANKAPWASSGSESSASTAYSSAKALQPMAMLRPRNAQPAG